MINDLPTTTEKWIEEHGRINTALLQAGSLQGVPVKVIGSRLTLSGRVRSEADKAAATQLVSSFSNLRIVNSISVVPGSVFSIPQSG